MPTPSSGTVTATCIPSIARLIPMVEDSDESRAALDSRLPGYSKIPSPLGRLSLQTRPDPNADVDSEPYLSCLIVEAMFSFPYVSSNCLLASVGFLASIRASIIFRSPYPAATLTLAL